MKISTVYYNENKKSIRKKILKLNKVIYNLKLAHHIEKKPSNHWLVETEKKFLFEIHVLPFFSTGNYLHNWVLQRIYMLLPCGDFNMFWFYVFANTFRQ
jgi:hypothetical protein